MESITIKQSIESMPLIAKVFLFLGFSFVASVTIVLADMFFNKGRGLSTANEKDDDILSLYRKKEE